MESKHKERLKTYDEYEINSIILFTVLYVIILVNLLLEKSNDPESNADKILIVFTIIYFVVCTVITVKHFYGIIMKNNAFKYGYRVKGHVKAIKAHKILVHSRNGDYYSRQWDLIIGYKYNGEMCEAKFGRYSHANTPDEYISAGDNCNVYIYKGKVYLQNLYKEEKNKTDVKIIGDEIRDGKYDNTPLNELLKYSIAEIPLLDRQKKYEALEERDLFSLVRSKSYLIVKPIHFYNNGIGYVLIVEVHISSLIVYNEMDFSLNITLGRYMKKYEADNVLLNEQILQKDVEQIVKSNIRGSTIQASVKNVEMVLVIEYKVESIDVKEKKNEYLNDLKADVENGKYTNINFEEIAYCSAPEISKLKSKELNKVYSEREIFSQIKSREFMLLPSVILLYPKIKVIYIDIFIVSADLYCEKDFLLYEKMQDYASTLTHDATQYEERLLKENIRQLVSLTIRDVDSSVEILDIVVEIQDYLS